jgi:hypothetical protein
MNTAPSQRSNVAAFAGAGLVIEADGEVEEEVEGDYEPVGEGELHK